MLVLADVLHEGSEAVVVRTPPIDPAAVRAGPEVLVVPPCPWRQEMLDILLSHGFEQVVALEASAEGSDGSEQVEPAHDL